MSRNSAATKRMKPTARDTCGTHCGVPEQAPVARVVDVLLEREARAVPRSDGGEHDAKPQTDKLEKFLSIGREPVDQKLDLDMRVGALRLRQPEEADRNEQVRADLGDPSGGLVEDIAGNDFEADDESHGGKSEGGDEPGED